MRVTRRRNLGRLVSGLSQAQHVHLSRVADALPGRARQPSKTRRLRRLLANEAIDPERIYRPVAQRLLRRAAESGPLGLLVDTLELTGRRRLLVAALAYRRRALPILWRVDRATGVTSAPVQRRFAQRLAALVPEAARVVLVGDGEFHCIGLLRQARHQGWDFCVRLHADTYVRPLGKARWRECRALDPVEGQRRYVEAARVTKAHGFGPVGLVYHWAEGEDAPWRLVTSLSSSRKTVRFYRKRMWIEELFGDWQGGGFRLGHSRIYQPDRLSRLVLGLSLTYVWIVAVASYIVKRGWRSVVDRTDRRDQSYATIGHKWIQRCLINDQPLHVRLLPYF